MNYWLIKSEASCYSVTDLKRDTSTAWTGVRNYQARNFMRDSMNVGDKVLFYHSGGTKTEQPGVYGTAIVTSSAHPDETQFDVHDDHYDPKSSVDNPAWVYVDISFESMFRVPVTLAMIKHDPSLAGIMVASVGSRLSIQPVSASHFSYIVETMTKHTL